MGVEEGGFYRLSTRAGKRAQLDGFKHGLPLFPTTSTTPYHGHCWRVVKMERYRVCARECAEEEAEKNFRASWNWNRNATPDSRFYCVSLESDFTLSLSLLLLVLLLDSVMLWSTARADNRMYNKYRQVFKSIIAVSRQPVPVTTESTSANTIFLSKIRQ